jgi:hypothetical protein
MRHASMVCTAARIAGLSSEKMFQISWLLPRIPAARADQDAAGILVREGRAQGLDLPHVMRTMHPVKLPPFSRPERA